MSNARGPSNDAPSNAGVPTTVADIMTRKLVTLGEDDTIEKVEESMGKFRFRHLPVVRGTKLVGLITHRDMLQISSSSLSTQREIRDRLIRQVPASRIMRTEVATVSAGESVARAGELMWEMKVGCLCVTDDEDNLVGIVTEADYLRLAVKLVRKLAPATPPGPPPKAAPKKAPATPS